MVTLCVLLLILERETKDYNIRHRPSEYNVQSNYATRKAFKELRKMGVLTFHANHYRLNVDGEACKILKGWGIAMDMNDLGLVHRGLL